MHQATEAAFLDEFQKIAAAVSFAKKKGLGRIGELLSGSRVKRLEERGLKLTAREDRAIRTGRAAFDAIEPDDSPAMFEAMDKNIKRTSHARDAYSDARRGARLAREHEEKQVLRTRVGAGAGVVAAGAGGAAAIRHKRTDKK